MFQPAKYIHETQDSISQIFEAFSLHEQSQLLVKTNGGDDEKASGLGDPGVEAAGAEKGLGDPGVEAAGAKKTVHTCHEAIDQEGFKQTFAEDARKDQQAGSRLPEAVGREGAFEMGLTIQEREDSNGGPKAIRDMSCFSPSLGWSRGSVESELVIQDLAASHRVQDREGTIRPTGMKAWEDGTAARACWGSSAASAGASPIPSFETDPTSSQFSFARLRQVFFFNFPLLVCVR